MNKAGGEEIEKEMEEESVESVGLKSFNYTNMIERYFTRYYFDYGKETEQYAFIHSNGYYFINLQVLLYSDLEKIILLIRRILLK